MENLESLSWENLPFPAEPENELKKIQECGNTDMTGLAISDAQPSRVNTCIKENTDDPKFENSINTLPYSAIAIIAKTYKNTPKTKSIATKFGKSVENIFKIRFNLENLFIYFNSLKSLKVLRTIK